MIIREKGPILYGLLIALLEKCLNSVLYVKALAGAFNQVKALIGAFYVIVETDGSITQLYS